MIPKRKLFKAFLTLTVFVLIFYVSLIVKIYGYTNINEAQNTDAIVVMGASQWNGYPSPIFKNRLEHALSLYQKGLSSKFILTGGTGKGEKISESRVGENYLVGNDIAAKNIFTEEVGRTSLQSLMEIAQILKNQNLNSVILVSDGFHMMRLNKMAKDLNINVYLSAASNNSFNKLSEFKYVLRESLVYLLYLLFKI